MGKRFHDIRHTFITDIANDGTPLPVVQSTAGHTDLKVTQKYIHADKKKNVEALKDYVAL